MNLTNLTALSPLDGRYRTKIQNLAHYFSEYALIKYRIKIEIEYFIALCKIPLPQLKELKTDTWQALRNIAINFSEENANVIKNIEKKTNHDVKAVEYFLKDHLTKLGLSKYSEFIHFGLTSQDINNTAIPLLLKHAMHEAYHTALLKIIDQLAELSHQWADIPMLARTHGQPASPTKVGKELLVFHERLQQQYTLLQTIPYKAKFGGATGNFNAHHVAYSTIDWHQFAENFINNQLMLQRSYPTTQIEHYDYLATLFDNLCRINTILISFSQDIWQYISIGYFQQKTKKNEIGSSAMPHKINPIDFENAEGNLGIANAIFSHLSKKLPISRLQRDLTDSTVLRNIGVPMGHTLVALQALQNGLEKITLNEKKIQKDLADNWVVVAEGIQTILRREGYPQPYEALKELARNNQTVTVEIMNDFIETLNINESVKNTLRNITPFNYTGPDTVYSSSEANSK